MLAAVAAVGGDVRLNGLRFPSADADAGALPVLEAMGLTVSGSPAGLAASARAGALRAVATRATDFPDAVPALAAAAALAEGSSRFEGIGHLRLKESDRIAALSELICSAGGRAAAEGNTLVVSGPARPQERPMRLPTRRDHRIAMAGAILALRLPGLLIEAPACVAKSYPEFFRDLERLCRR
jgi:3-phosphoshikimate 1-carboxyvinyltransferase